MANEFIARKGLIVPSGSILVNTGSVNVGGAVTASFFKGDGSQLINLPSTATSSVTITTNTFTGNGAQTQFNLNTLYSITSLFVSVDGLFYTPTVDYTVSGSIVTFTSAPPSASDITIRSLINVFDGAVGTFSGSFIGDLTGSLIGTSSWANNAVTASYVNYTNIDNKPTLVSASSQIDVRNTTGIATIATTGSNTFAGTQTIAGNIFLSSSFPLVYNNSATNNMLFGFFDGGAIYGAYYQTFGNNYPSLSQRGGAEFVYDVRNNSDANFHVASFNGSTWTEKFRVDDTGIIVTGSIKSTGGVTGSLLGTSSWAEHALTSSYIDYSNIDNKPTLVSASSQVDITQTTNYSTFSSSIATKNDTQDVSINALNAATSSYALQTQLQGVPSSSSQVKAYLPDGTVSSSAQYPGWVTSSAQVDITQTTNYSTFSSSIATKNDSQDVSINALNNLTGSYATTGSNTFTGIQNISDTTNSTSYLDGALVVAGGVGITKDVHISGALTVNGLFTAVSMSTQYVTSSQYNVGVSKITLNDDDLVRFAGISIYDSGSSTPSSASIYWDSLQDRFIYENTSGSNYNSAVIIAGPKHTGSLGDEQELIIGRIPVASGGDHIDNSPARVINNTVHFDENIYVTGSISATSITSSLYGTSSLATTASYATYAANADLFDGKDSVTFATTGSNTFIGTQAFSGSINFESGSSISPMLQDLEIKPGVGGEILLFNSDSTHYLSINATGSTITDLNVLNGITGSLFGTSSVATNAISSSYALTSSYALNAGAGAGFPFSGSAVITGSLLVVDTGSVGGITGSLLGTSSAAISSSYAQTASYALNAGAGSGFPFSGSAVITGSLYVSGSTISGSFKGDGSQLTNINIGVAVVSDIYKFVGDGTTQLFVLSQSYFTKNVQVSVDGLVFTEGVDYTYNTGSVLLVIPPPSSSNVLVSALLNTQNDLTGSFSGSFIGDARGLVNIPLAIDIDTYKFEGDGTTTNYAISHSYGPNSLFVSVNGVTFTSPEDFTVSSNTISFTEIPASSSNILIRGFVTQSLIESASFAVTSSFAQTASYALNAGAGAGFPYSGSAVITGSLYVVPTGSVGGITGSFSGSGAGLTDLRTSLALDTYSFIGDGTTLNYVLSQSYTPNSLFVSVEGINYINVEDFTVSSSTLTFAVAPPTQSNISVKALLSVSSGSYINYTGSFIGDGYGLDNLRGALAIETIKFIGDGTTTVFTLSSSYHPNSMLVTVGGLRYIDTNDYTLTSNLLQFTQAPASESIIVAQAYVIVSSGSVGTFSGSFIGNATTSTAAQFALSSSYATTASYANVATTASFASNVLKTKAGSIVSSSFGGTPLSASVTFGSAFNNTNYSVAITGEDARIFTVENKTSGGFVVNTNSNTALTGTTYWTCTAFGEN